MHLVSIVQHHQLLIELLAILISIALTTIHSHMNVLATKIPNLTGTGLEGLQLIKYYLYKRIYYIL